MLAYLSLVPQKFIDLGDDLPAPNILLSNLLLLKFASLLSPVSFSSKISAYVICKLVILNSARVAISLMYEEVSLQFQGLKSHRDRSTPIFIMIRQIFPKEHLNGSLWT